jgi:hypothetical protein
MTTKSEILADLAVITAKVTALSDIMPHGAGFTTELESGIAGIATDVGTLVTYVAENL